MLVIHCSCLLFGPCVNVCHTQPLTEFYLFVVRELMILCQIHQTTEITSQRCCLYFIHHIISARNDWKRLGVVLKEEFLFQNPFAHGNVLWMRVSFGLILLYSWMLLMSSLPAYTQHSLYYPTVCRFGRKMNVISILISPTHKSTQQITYSRHTAFTK